VLSTCSTLIRKALSRPWALVLGLIGLGLLGVGGYLGWQQVCAWRHYFSAQQALERRDFPAAHEHLQACLETWPGSASTHLLAARTARRGNRLDEAAEHLEACEELGGPMESIVLEEDLIRAQRGRLADVEERLVSCINLDHPDSVFILETLTWELMMHEYRLHEAQAYLDLWLQRRPDDREALVRRGWVREHLLDLEEAIRAYGRALDLDPDQDRIENDRVRLRLGQLLVQKLRAGEAIRHFEVMYERQPRNQDVVLGLARCCRHLNQQEKARRLLDDFLAEQPQSGQALGERGGLALDRGQLVEAAIWLRKAAALCPHDRQIVSNTFKCLEAMGQKTEAEKYLARLTEIRADEERMSRLMRQVMKSPRDAELLCEVGRIFLRNGLSDDGTRFLAAALVHNPRHGAAHQALADHYAATGQPDRAAPHLRALRQLENPNPNFEIRNPKQTENQPKSKTK
jgi:tetratricopeptide (TPR) repeat protein